MKIYTEIIGNLQDPEWVKKAREAEIEYIDLDQWTAQKSRFVVKGDRENEYLGGTRSCQRQPALARSGQGDKGLHSADGG